MTEQTLQNAHPVQCLHLNHRDALGRQMFNDASLLAEQGELLFLSGQNGSGKSMLISMILGRVAPEGGVVLVQGMNPAELDWWKKRRFNRLVRHVPEDCSLPPGKSVYENISSEMPSRGNPDLARDRVRRLLSRTGLEPYASCPTFMLSRSEKKLLGLAVAVAADPLVLLADDPLSGLSDPAKQSVIHLATAATVRGTAVIFTTLDPDAANLAPGSSLVKIVRGRFERQ